MRGYVSSAPAVRAIALAFALASIAAAPAPFAEFQVNSFSDAPDATPGDGICSTTPGDETPVCTLRAAVMEMAAFGGGPYVIRLEAGTYPLSTDFVGQRQEDVSQSVGTIELLRAAENNDLDLAAAVRIIGAGQSATFVDGSNQFRVFDVIRNQATFEDLTIRNGRVSSDVGGGAGVRVGAAAAASLIRVTVRGNEATLTSASATGKGGRGGGVEASGITTIQQSIIRNNRAQRLGGGIYAQQDLNVVDSIVTVNTVAEARSDLRIRGSLRQGSGGGIAGLSQGGAQCVSVRITGSTISGNVSQSMGGGLAVSGDLRITNSTVSGNRGAEGGGVFYENAFCREVRGQRRSVFRGSFSTIALNDSTLRSYAGGLYLDGNVDTRVEGVLLARNHDSGGSVVNCGGVVRYLYSDGHNADDGFTCGFRHATDKVGSYIDFGPLADNGGPTPTHALAPSPIFLNPAIDGGGSTAPGVDQRGVTRPQGAAWDIGAFEFEGVFPGPIIRIPVEVPGNVTFLDAFVIPIQLGGPGIGSSEINDILPGGVGGTFSVELSQDRRSAIVRGTQIGLDLSKPSDNPNGGRPVLFSVFVTRPLQGDIELRVIGGEIDGKVRYEGNSLWIIKPLQ